MRRLKIVAFCEVRDAEALIVEKANPADCQRQLKFRRACDREYRISSCRRAEALMIAKIGN
jgi:hypothetical protein